MKKVPYRNGYPALSWVKRIVEESGVSINDTAGYKITHSIHWGESAGNSHQRIESLVALFEKHGVQIKEWKQANSPTTGKIVFRNLYHYTRLTPQTT